MKLRIGTFKAEDELGAISRGAASVQNSEDDEAAKIWEKGGCESIPERMGKEGIDVDATIVSNVARREEGCEARAKDVPECVGKLFGGRIASISKEGGKSRSIDVRGADFIYGIGRESENVWWEEEEGFRVEEGGGVGSETVMSHQVAHCVVQRDKF